MTTTTVPTSVLPPAPEAAAGTHEAVLQILDTLPRGRLLDAPSGRGALSAAAATLGFTVTACDIKPDVFAVPSICCERVDLQEALPYADGEFDVVVCVEGIEHVENPFHLLREFRRVLRPGGRLIVTTPNVLSLPSRLRVLTTGLAPYFDFDYWLRSTGHISPISAPQLNAALDRSGFSIASVGGNRIRSRARVLTPLAWVVQLLTCWAVPNPALKRLLTSSAVLFCEILVVSAS
jgi:SAM-dependent methyltransferase